MKKKFTLSLILLLSLTVSAFAIPTVPANNVQFPAAGIDGNRMQIKFNKGNGAMRIVVMKEGSAITTLPVNGTDYFANSVFNTPAAAFNGNDGYVVYRNSSSATGITVSVTGLTHSTRYYVAVFEFDGTGVNTQYLMVAATGNEMTKTMPTQQATINSITAVTGNKMTLNLAGGDGDKRLVLARKGAPVNADPLMLKQYISSSNFKDGNVINGDNYVVYTGTANSFTVTNLEPNTTYHFAVFSYNGDNGPVYLYPGNVNSQATNAGPTTGPGTINFSNIEGNRLTLTFAPGNGKYQLVIARKGAAVTAQPVNGETYEANTSFGDGDAVEDGQFVMNTTNSDRTFTNLDPASTYHFRVYTYDVDEAGNTYYLTTASSQGSRSTASAPVNGADNIRFDNITGSSARITYDQGDGDYRLVVMKLNSPVDVTPADLTRYNGNLQFGQGTQINPQVSPGNFVLIGGQNTNSLTVTGLAPGNIYHVAVFSFNGNNYPIYKTTPVTAQLVIPNQPSTPGTNFSTNSVEGNTFNIQWNGGDGARRIVIARKGAPVTAEPSDNATYTADPDFDEGTAILPGQFVVYDGPNRTVGLRKLDPGATYHFAVFEYNLTGTDPDYLVSSFLTGTGTTASAPTSQAAVTLVDNIQNTQARINFSVGNGASRLFIMRADSPVDVEPQDLTSYQASTAYGSQQLGSGNYIVQKTSSGNAFNVTSLTPNTHYYIAVFEFNGSGAPIYLRPAATFDFTTTAAPVPPPTNNASNPAFSEIEGNSIKFEWQNGDGAKRIVVARQGAPVSFTPADGTNYLPNPSFNQGTDIGGGQFVVFNGIQDEVTVTNLLPSTTYHFAVFEYNGADATIKYLTTGVLTASRSTVVTPASGSTGLGATTNNLTMTISWNSGPGERRLVVVKEGSAVNGTPADLGKYTPQAEFGDGAQIATGEYVVYAGTGNSVTVTGLEYNKTYHYTVFDYNGLEAPMYNTANKISGSTLLSSPLPLSWLFVKANEQNNGDILIEWATSQEVNTSHFIIERSQNGVFTAIGNIAAKGSESRNDYSFTDNAHLSGTVSYRIKQVDIDGNFEYSKQVVVRPINQQGVMKLYPNPAPGYTRISLPQGVQQATVKIFDQMGKLTKTAAVTNGELITLNGLPTGIYYVVVNDGSNQYKEMMIVQ